MGRKILLEIRTFDDLKREYESLYKQAEDRIDLINHGYQELGIDDHETIEDEFYHDFMEELKEGEDSFLSFYNLKDIRYNILELKEYISSLEMPHHDPIEQEPLAGNQLV